MKIALTAFTAIMLLVLGGPMARAGVDEDAQYWGALQAQGRFSALDPAWKRLYWYFEAQGRLFEDGDRLGQGFFRPALGYFLTESIGLWLGYAWLTNAPAGAGTEDFDEHRIWQQITWSTRLESVLLSTRSRLEQRLVQTGTETGWRFRQQVKAIVPLPFEPRLSLVGWDEIFVNINATDWGAEEGLDQNRAFIGFGWNFDRANRFRTEIGYLNQFIENATGSDRDNHVLSATLFLNF